MNKNTLQIFQIDAFTSEIFKGNPACVMPLDNWLPDDTLLKIAKENSEYHLRICKYHLRICK